MSDAKFVGLTLLVLGVLIAIFVGISNAQTHACEDKGGHIVHVYKSNLCVSQDGRIIE